MRTTGNAWSSYDQNVQAWPIAASRPVTSVGLRHSASEDPRRSGPRIAIRRLERQFAGLSGSQLPAGTPSRTTILRTSHRAAPDGVLRLALGAAACATHEESGPAEDPRLPAAAPLGSAIAAGRQRLSHRRRQIDAVDPERVRDEEQPVVRRYRQAVGIDERVGHQLQQRLAGPEQTTVPASYAIPSGMNAGRSIMSATALPPAVVRADSIRSAFSCLLEHDRCDVTGADIHWQHPGGIRQHDHRGVLIGKHLQAR